MNLEQQSLKKYTQPIYKKNNYLSGGIVALLGWSLLASHGSLAVLGLVLAAVEVHGEDAGPVLDNFLLVPAVLVVNVHALEVVLVGDG